MKRREFCRRLTITGGAVVLAPLLNACRTLDPDAAAELAAATSRPTATAVPTGTTPATATSLPAATNTPPADPTTPPTTAPEPTQEPTVATDTATVALVKTSDRAAGVQQAIALLAANNVRGLPVLLKPNFNSADPAPASTHPDTLTALIQALQDQGARRITIGERSGMGVTRDVMQQVGAFDIAEKWGVETAVFDELADSDWVVRGNGDFHWPDGFAVPRLLLDSPCVVQTCNLKTHGFGGHFTLSLKNSVGFAAKTVGSSANYMTQLHNSRYQREMIAEINAVYEPALIVVDGIAAFVDGGPHRGTLVQPNVVLAGTDRIALDAVGVAILRLFGTTSEVATGPIFAQAQLARAVELGLGIDSPAKIRFVTADAESQAYADLVSGMLQ